MASKKVPSVVGRVPLRSQLLLALRKGEYSISLISQCRKRVPPQTLPELVAFVHSHPHSNKRLRRVRGSQGLPVKDKLVLGTPFPQTYQELWDGNGLGSVESSQEFLWAAEYLILHSEKIRQFISWMDEYYDSYLNRDWHNAEAILGQIESQLGKSVWLLKNKINLLQAFRGTDSQKQFANEVRTQIPEAFPSLIAFYASMRNEPPVTALRFRNGLEDVLKNVGFPESLSDYLRYHAIPNTSMSSHQLSNILRLEARGSVIDYYESFIFALQCSLTHGYDFFSELLSRSIRNLATSTKDDRLLMMCSLAFRHDVPLTSWRHATGIVDSFIHGKFQSTIDQALIALSEKPQDIITSTIEARSRACNQDLTGNIPTQEQSSLSSQLTQLIEYDSNWTEIVTGLMKEATNFFGAPWSYLLAAAVEEEISDHPVPSKGSMSHFAAMGMAKLHPYGATFFPAGAHQDRYLELLESNNIISTSEINTKYPQIIYGKNKQSLSDEELIIEGEHFYSLNDFARSNDCGEQLLDSDLHYYRRKGARLKSWSLIKTDRLREANELITTFALKEEFWKNHLPILTAAVETADSTSPDTFADDLSTSILFELCSQVAIEDFSSDLVLSYIDLLTAFNETRPSALLKIQEQFDSQKFIYFLRFVCVESVMDRSGFFDRSQDVLEERLAVCRILMEIDNENIDSYQLEIKYLLRRIVVQKRTKEVEQSKIFVDTESVKRTASGEIRELYNRYKELSKSKLNFLNAKSGLTFIYATSEGLIELKGPDLPSDDALALHDSIIKKLRDEYVYSTVHGLDKYLSVRIRHGVLESQLRRPAENHALITNREEDTQRYQRNEFWEKRLRFESAGDRRNLISRLDLFSKEYDDFINDIKSWIQISKGSTSAGLFNFDTGLIIMSLPPDSIAVSRSFEEFIATTLDKFADILDINLLRIRERIVGEAKNNAQSIFDQLTIDVNNIIGKDASGELVNAINAARTDLQVALDRISTWFRRAEGTGNEPFYLQEAIEISAATVRAFDSSFDILWINEDDLLVDGIYLAIFVDIFFIIFQNIAKHAGPEVPHMATVELEVSSDSLFINVNNPVTLIDEQYRSKISGLRAQVYDSRNSILVRNEGGTGFYKLFRLLSHDLSVTADLDFGFNDKDEFFVSAMISKFWK